MSRSQMSWATVRATYKRKNRKSAQIRHETSPQDTLAKMILTTPMKPVASERTRKVRKCVPRAASDQRNSSHATKKHWATAMFVMKVKTWIAQMAFCGWEGNIEER